MGKGARRMTRWSAAIVLVGTVSSGTAAAAHANAAGGIDVPDSTFRQGTGTQEISISIGPPAVGTTETLIIWPYGTARSRWMLGVTADRSTGAACGYDVGQWQCAPGPSGWHAGRLAVQVSTATAMDCGLQRGVCDLGELNVQSMGGPPDNQGGPPSGQPFSASGNVVIMPASLPTRSTSAPTPSPPVYRPIATTSAAQPPAATPTTSSPPPPTPSAAPSTSSAALAPTGTEPTPTEPSATSIEAENTSLTTAPHGSPIGLYLALLIPILLGVGGPLGYHLGKRRRRRGAAE